MFNSYYTWNLSCLGPNLLFCLDFPCFKHSLQCVSLLLIMVFNYFIFYRLSSRSIAVSNFYVNCVGTAQSSVAGPLIAGRRINYCCSFWLFLICSLGCDFPSFILYILVPPYLHVWKVSSFSMILKSYCFSRDPKDVNFVWLTIKYFIHLIFIGFMVHFFVFLVAVLLRIFVPMI